MSKLVYFLFIIWLLGVHHFFIQFYKVWKAIKSNH